MDGTLLIDNLKYCPDRKRKDEMKYFEFFECDFCSRICEMPIEQYKSYTDDEILYAKYRCEGCAKKMARPSETDHITKEQLEQLKLQGLNNRAIARHFNISEVTIYNLLRKFGLSTPRQKKDTVLIQKDKPITNHFPDVSNMVEHPPHYTAGGIECIDAIMAAVEGLTPQEAVCVANVLKYTWRFKKKNGKQDLEKAGWYLNRLIQLQGS